MHTLLLNTQRIPDIFLAGFEDLDFSFRNWLFAKRQSIHDKLLRALKRSLSNDRLEDTIKMEVAEAILNLDPTHEETCRYLMRARMGSGDIAGALRVYKSLWDLLGDEYDMEPSAETLELVAEIKSGRADFGKPERELLTRGDRTSLQDANPRIPGTTRAGAQNQSDNYTQQRWGNIFDRGFDAAISNEDTRPIGRSNKDGTTSLGINDRPPITKVSSAATGRPPRIAVLPFQQLSGSHIPSYLTDGLVADVVCQLAGLRELCVISFGSTIGIRDPNVEPRSLGQILDTRYVVRGVIRRNGAALRLTSELVETDTNAVISAHTNDASGDISFEDQDKLVGQIVHALVPSIHAVKLQRIRGKRTENLTAYELVLMARQRLLTLDHAGFSEARAFLTRAMEIDPDYAEAFALLADWHGLRISQGISTNREYDRNRADLLGREALARDPNNVRALTRYAHRKALLLQDFGSAVELFDRALSIMPRAAHTVMWSSHTFAYMGEAQEAVRRAEDAISLSPRDVEAHYFLGALCMAHYTNGDYEAAADAGLRALAEPRPSRSFRQFTVAALTAIGRREEARPIVARMIADQPGYRVQRAVANLPHRDPVIRSRYAQQLIEAGLPS